MLSTQYRLRLESICRCIANKEEVPLEDMIWAEKLAKAHTLARDWLNKARRQAKGIEEDELKVSVSQKEIEKIIKQYKKLKKAERSNLSHIKKLGDGWHLW